MPKHKHHRDRLYLLQSEYCMEWGGYKKKSLFLPLRALPFDCCGLTLRPFTEPVCTEAGNVFDASAILPYIRQYKRCPVSGEPLQVSQLIPLIFHKNASGKYHCPITFKEFGSNTHIVANKKSGHVYAAEAIENLCKKPKNWVDLMTGEAFTSADLIQIQNPSDSKRRCVEHFYHVKQGQDFSVKGGGVEAEAGSLQPHIRKNEWMRKVLDEAEAKKVDLEAAHNRIVPNINAQAPADNVGTAACRTNAEEKLTHNADTGLQNDGAEGKDPEKHHLYTDHRMAAGFTSTVVVGRTTQVYRELSEREQLAPVYAHCKQNNIKSYIRLQTTAGSVNIELYSHLTPRTVDSFLRHCASGYYEGTIFHRLIPNFIIQGGRAELRRELPSRVQTAKQPLVSCSGFPGGRPFEDEIMGRLTHQGIGVIGMANDGRRNRNLSEFYITFKSCTHLDGKHTIFGRVVGGLEVLREWETLSVDAADRPKKPPIIEKVHVFKNAFDEAKQVLRKQKQDEATKDVRAAEEAARPWFNNRDALDESANHPDRYSDKVGRYIRLPSSSTEASASALETVSGISHTGKDGDSSTTSDAGERGGIPGTSQGSHAHAEIDKPLVTPVKRPTMHPAASKMGFDAAQYATVPRRVKVARKEFDFSSWG